MGWNVAGFWMFVSVMPNWLAVGIIVCGNFIVSTFVDIVYVKLTVPGKSVQYVDAVSDNFIGIPRIK